MFGFGVGKVWFQVKTRILKVWVNVGMEFGLWLTRCSRWCWDEIGLRVSRLLSYSEFLRGNR